MMTCLRFLLFVLIFGADAASLRALESGDCFTLDLPFGANAATPAWLGHPVAGTGPFAALDLPVSPPEAGASLLITVFFQEQNGGFLRIGWQAAGAVPTEGDQVLPGPGEAAQSAVLCNNFYEGIGMSNQRSLLIPAEAMKQPGALHFQTGGATLGISRIEMEWLQDAVGIVSPAINDVLVTPANGPTRPASELAGQPPLARDPAWQGHLVDVPVTDLPLRIEQGVDFAVQVNGAPTMARIALKEAGLPWGRHLVVWLNDQRAGVVVPSTPPLDNGGYASTPGGSYVGWREGTFLVPPGAIVAGQDTIQFSSEPDVASATADNAAAPATPLALKDVVLQLAYPAVEPTTASPVAAASATPSAVSPSSSTSVSAGSVASDSTGSTVSPTTSPADLTTPVTNP